MTSLTWSESFWSSSTSSSVRTAVARRGTVPAVLNLSRPLWMRAPARRRNRWPPEAGLFGAKLGGFNQAIDQPRAMPLFRNGLISSDSRVTGSPPGALHHPVWRRHKAAWRITVGDQLLHQLLEIFVSIHGHEQPSDPTPQLKSVWANGLTFSAIFSASLSGLKSPMPVNSSSNMRSESLF